MSEPTSQRRADVARQAQEIAKIDREVLYRTKELGDKLSFKEGAAVFDRAFFFLSRLTEKSLALVPPDTFDQIAGYVQKFGARIGEIQSFDSAAGEPLRLRNNLLANIDEEFRRLLREHPMALLAVLPPAVEESDEMEALDKRLKEFDGFAAKAHQDLVVQLKTADGIVDAIRESSGKVAVKKYATFFEQEADSAGGAAKNWLWATVLAGFALFAVLLALVFVWQPEERSPSQLVQAGGAKIALFSVCFYLVSWCGRNYKAHRHIHVVNKHRANTLNSMEAYANAVGKQDTRDAILVHASAAIFAQVSTGLIPDQSDSPATPTIMEIVRGRSE